MMKALTPSGSMFMSFSSPKGSKAAEPTVSSLVAGMDISKWDVVVVDGVPPGPLGILLDGNCPEAAVLDDFAPISSDGAKGTVELDGRVVVGSVLIGVNDYDLLEHRLTLQEVGKVLRETSQVMRTLIFRVPPTRALEALEASGVSSMGSPKSSAAGEAEQRVLLKGMDKSSYKEKPTPEVDGGKGSWNIKSLLSPSQIASSVAVMSGFRSTTPTAQSPSSTQAPAPASTPTPVVVPPPSPTSTSVRTPTHTGSSKSVGFSNKLAVKIPPGPIGLNLDGSIADRAVVLGFLPLPDGSTGELERRGDIPSGSVLVAINGSSVTHLTLDEIRARLGALAGFERELVFELPLGGEGRPLTAKDREAAFNRLGDLDKRRKMELALVLKNDKTKIKRNECWLLIDAQWMAKWLEFTAMGGVNPGPITNHVLLEANWEARACGLAAGRPDTPRAGLQLMKDYRCVTPMVWALFAEFHGTNNVPVQARYVLDAYAEPLAENDINSILQEPRLKAASIVNDLRDKYPSAFH